MSQPDVHQTMLKAKEFVQHNLQGLCRELKARDDLADFSQGNFHWKTLVEILRPISDHSTPVLAERLVQQQAMAYVLSNPPRVGDSYLGLEPDV